MNIMINATEKAEINFHHVEEQEFNDLAKRLRRKPKKIKMPKGETVFWLEMEIGLTKINIFKGA